MVVTRDAAADRLIDDILLVGGWACLNLPWGGPPNPHLRRDTIGDTVRDLVAAAREGDFPSLRTLWPIVTWTVTELYWLRRGRRRKGLTPYESEVYAAVLRLFVALGGDERDWRVT
jgi:hypothetical protein